MLARNMQEGALVAREAHLALEDLKRVVDGALAKARAASLDAAGLAVSQRPGGDPLSALTVAADSLQPAVLDRAVSHARHKVETAVAWHKGIAQRERAASQD